MSNGKKIVLLILLIVLTLVLIGVIVFLAGAIKNQKMEQKELEDKVQALSKEKNDLENELAKAKATIKTIQTNDGKITANTDEQHTNETNNTSEEIGVSQSDNTIEPIQSFSGTVIAQDFGNGKETFDITAKAIENRKDQLRIY